MRGVDGAHVEGGIGRDLREVVQTTDRVTATRGMEDENADLLVESCASTEFINQAVQLGG